MPCRVSTLQVGDYISRQSYYNVRGLQVTNLRNNSWTLPRHILEDECYSTRPRSDLPAAQRVFELPLTGLCEKLHSVGDKVFEATFTKKDGSERVMVAYHLGSDTWLGRSNVMELVLDKGKFIARKRQIDHRTLTSVVFGGVQYKLKKRGRSSPPNPEEDAAPAVHKARSSDLQRDDVVARISYCRVVGITRDGVQVQNLNGKQWSIGVSIVEDEFNAATSSSSDEAVPLTMTGLCEKLHEAGDKVFCVVFVKKDGTERTMFAHHIGKGKDTWLGRSEVMELVHKNGRLQEERKQVDHRTIKQLVVGGKKYVLKTSSGSRRRTTPPPAPVAAPPPPAPVAPVAPVAAASTSSTTRRGRSTANKNKRKRGATAASSSTSRRKKQATTTTSSRRSTRTATPAAAAAPAPRRSRRLAALNSSAD